MDRVKITFVVLLPALWLMASGQGLLDPCDQCINAGAQDSVLAFESGQHCPSSAAGTVDLPARRTNPRAGVHSAKRNFPPLGPIARSQAPDRTLRISCSQRAAALALAARWQFDYRAASEPRAPSLVS